MAEKKFIGSEIQFIGEVERFEIKFMNYESN